jgi:hypothetical protein
VMEIVDHNLIIDDDFLPTWRHVSSRGRLGGWHFFCCSQGGKKEKQAYIWGRPIVIVTTNGVFLPFLLAFFGFSFKFLIFVLFIDFHFGDDRYGEFSTIRHWRLWCKNLNQKKISWFQQ